MPYTTKIIYPRPVAYSQQRTPEEEEEWQHIVCKAIDRAIHRSGKRAPKLTPQQCALWRDFMEAPKPNLRIIGGTDVDAPSPDLEKIERTKRWMSR